MTERENLRTSFPTTRILSLKQLFFLLSPFLVLKMYCSILFLSKRKLSRFSLHVDVSANHFLLLLPQVEAVQWTFDNINSETGELHHLAAFLADKKIDMVINLPMRGSGARR